MERYSTWRNASGAETADKLICRTRLWHGGMESPQGNIIHLEVQLSTGVHADDVGDVESAISS